jgi:hypothetical protein
MRTCDSCGFENAEPAKACPLCGAADLPPVPSPGSITVDGVTRTVQLPADRTWAAPVARPVPADLQGRVFGDRYEIEGEIGRGGMGRVYRVRDRATGRAGALKVLEPASAHDPDRLERFRREIEILSRLQHSAITAVLGWGMDGADPFFVTELVVGCDLKEDIRRRGPRPAEEAADLVATVAEALAAAHAAGVIHRDVKPSNIMLAADGSVKLVDFGLARGLGLDLTTLTRTGMIVGTPGYMAPEQFEGRPIDGRCDLYALGIVLFELLTGRLPFTGQTPIAVALKHKTEPPPSPRALRGGVPRWLERAIFRSLEKDPDRRYATAADMAADLRRRRDQRQVTRLPTGDALIEDDALGPDWALTLAAPREKTGWTEGMALRFDEAFFKLAGIEVPEAPGGRWVYRFLRWPEGEAFRRLVDYAEDSAVRQAVPEEGAVAKIMGWLRGRRP